MSFDIIAAMESDYKPSSIFKYLVKHGIDAMPWYTRDISYNLIPHMFSSRMQYMIVDHMAVASCQVGLVDEFYNDVHIPMTSSMRKAWNDCIWLNCGGYAFDDILTHYKKHEAVIEEEFAAMLVAMFETSKRRDADICLRGGSCKAVLCKKTDDFTPICDCIKKDFPEIRQWLNENEMPSQNARSLDRIAQILVDYEVNCGVELPWVRFNAQYW